MSKEKLVWLPLALGEDSPGYKELQVALEAQERARRATERFQRKVEPILRQKLGLESDQYDILVAVRFGRAAVAYKKRSEKKSPDNAIEL